MPKLNVSTKGDALNRLAPHNAAPRTDKVQHLLDHLDDAGGDRADEAATIREWLADPTWGDKTIADIITKEICRPDALGYTIGPVAVRNHRETM